MHVLNDILNDMRIVWRFSREQNTAPLWARLALSPVLEVQTFRLKPNGSQAGWSGSQKT